MYLLLGASKIIANLYNNYVYLNWERLRDLQYIVAVIYGTPSILRNVPVVASVNVKVCFVLHRNKFVPSLKFKIN